ELRAGVFFIPADLREPVRTAVDDVGQAGERLDVVDDRGAAEDAVDGRKGRLDARLASLSFQALDQAGLLAADVGAGSAVHVEVDRDPGAEDVLAEKALRVGLIDRPIEDSRPV